MYADTKEPRNTATGAEGQVNHVTEPSREPCFQTGDVLMVTGNRRAKTRLGLRAESDVGRRTQKMPRREGKPPIYTRKIRHT